MKSNNQMTRDRFEFLINNVWGRLDLALKEAIDANGLLEDSVYERGPEPQPRAAQRCNRLLQALTDVRRDAQDLLDACTRQNNVRLARQSRYEYYVVGIDLHGDATDGEYFPTKAEAMQELERISATFNCVNQHLVAVAAVVERVPTDERGSRVVITTSGDQDALRKGDWIV